MKRQVRGTDSAEKMARKSKSARKGGEHFDTESGQVLAERCGGSIKAKIERVREVVPNRSKDDVALILQSCDYNVETAVSCFTSGDADDVLGEWNIQGKKNGGGASKKKKKKKQGVSENGHQLPGENNPPNEDETERTAGHTTVATLPTTPEPKPTAKPAVPQHLLVPAPSNTNDFSQPSLLSASPSSSDSTLSSPKSSPSTEGSRERSLSSDFTAGSHRSKPERQSSFSGPEALKKTTKDLQRSSVTLPRFQLLLEEECEKSTAAISTTFAKLRQCLNEREVELAKLMKQVKEEAVTLLQQRLENAAALKLKAERVRGMDEAHISELRNEIRNFVSERKFDEELAKTIRFVGDEEKLKEEIKTFGEVVPIKNSYKPVILNPTPPNKPVEKEDVAPTAQIVPVVSASVVSSPPLVNEVNSPGLSHVSELHQRAEMHARLQASLKLQGISLEGSKKTNRKGRNNGRATRDGKLNSESERGEPTGEKPKEIKPNSNEQQRESSRSAGRRNARTKQEDRRNEGRPSTSNQQEETHGKRSTQTKREEQHKEDSSSASNHQEEAPRSPRKRNTRRGREEMPSANHEQAEAPQSPGNRNARDKPSNKQAEATPSAGAEGQERHEEKPDASTQQAETTRSPRKRNTKPRREETPSASNEQAEATASVGAEGQERREEKPGATQQAKAPRSPRKRNAQSKGEEKPGASNEQTEATASADAEGQTGRRGRRKRPQSKTVPAGEEEPLRKTEQGEREGRPRRNRRRKGAGRATEEEKDKRAGPDEASEVVQKDRPAGKEESTAAQEASKERKKRGRRNRTESVGSRAGKEGNEVKGESGASKEEGVRQEVEEGEERRTEVQKKENHSEDVKESSNTEEGKEKAVEAPEKRSRSVDGQASESTEERKERSTELQEKMDHLEASKTDKEGKERAAEAGEKESHSTSVKEESKNDEEMKEGGMEAPDKVGHSEDLKEEDEEKKSTHDPEMEGSQDEMEAQAPDLTKEKSDSTPEELGVEQPTTASQQRENTADGAREEISHLNGTTGQDAGQQGLAPTEALPQRKPRSSRRRNAPGRGQGSDSKEDLESLNTNNEHSMDHDAANGTSNPDTKPPHTEETPLEPPGDTKALPLTAPALQAPEGEKVAGGDGKAGYVEPISHINGFVQVNGNVDECLVER